MLFPTTNTAPTIQIFSLDPKLLAMALTSKQSLQTKTFDPSFKFDESLLALGPKFSPPWELNTEPRTLSNRLNEARNLKKFIDIHSADVRRAGDDKDSKTLFALYHGLQALQALAQYAAAKDTPTASLARLSSKFTEGLSQVRDFIATAKTDKVSLFLGEKTNRTDSIAGVRKNLSSFTGKVIQKGNRNDVLANVLGTETFTIRLTKNGTFDDILVDLSQITGPLTIDAVVNLVNQKISALPLLDASGNPVLDSNGNSFPKYVTKFKTEINKTFDYSIKIEGVSTEAVRLIPGTSEPALLIAGTLAPFTSKGAQTATLTRITDLSSATPTRTVSDQFAGVDAAATAVAKDAATSDTDTTNDVVEPVKAQTSADAIAVDSEGYTYIVGSSAGNFDSEVNVAKGEDVFLSKIDSNGDVVFTRLLGVAGDADAFSIVIDSKDNVIIAGQTDSNISGTDAVSGKDSYVTKFSSKGDVLFTYQLDTSATDAALGLAVDASDNIIVAGQTSGAISATSGFSGARDAYVLKIDGTLGTLTDSTVFGSAGSEEAKSVTIANDGNILVASTENGNAFIRKLDATKLSTEIFSYDLGSLQGGNVTGIAVAGTAVYLTGFTANAALTGGTATLTNTKSSGVDGFVTRLDDAGTSLSATFTTYVGGTGTDSVAGITVSEGKIYLAGETNNAITGETRIGVTDAFAARIDGTTGAIDFVEQFGQAFGEASAKGIAFAATGKSILETLGLRQGTVQQPETRDIVGQSSVRSGDFFYVAVDGGLKKKVTIKAGDKMSNLARNINIQDLRHIKATVIKGDNGDMLQIKAINGGAIELFRGTRDKDALGRMGIEPGKLLSNELVLNIDLNPDTMDVSDLGGSFGLGLNANFHLKDKTTAKFVLAKVDFAISTLQRAFRSLSFNPVKIALLRKGGKKNVGTAPAYLTARIANFQDALNRLQSSSLSRSTGFFI